MVENGYMVLNAKDAGTEKLFAKMWKKLPFYNEWVEKEFEFDKARIEAMGFTLLNRKSFMQKIELEIKTKYVLSVLGVCVCILLIFV